MQIQFVDKDAVMRAFHAVNQQFDDNIEFGRCVELEQDFAYDVSLRCLDATKAGHSLTPPDPVTKQQRRIVTACFHVYKAFFDALPGYALVFYKQHWIRQVEGGFTPGFKKGYSRAALCDCMEYENPRDRRVNDHLKPMT